LGKRPHTEIDKLRIEELKLDRVEERLAEIEDELREVAAKSGQRTAKKLLKKIDSIFSGAGFDPQDVKVIFNPISKIQFSDLVMALKEITLLQFSWFQPLTILLACKL